MVSRKSEEGCARMLRALADETRLAVVRMLLGGPRFVGELNRKLKLDPTLLSHHLRVLREMGLVTAQRDGKAIRYRLARDVRAQLRGNAVDLGCCCLEFSSPPTGTKAAMGTGKAGTKRGAPSYRRGSEYKGRRAR